MTFTKTLRYDSNELFFYDIILYQQLEMRPEAHQELDSLIKISGEIKELEYLNFAKIKKSVVEHEEMLRKIEEITGSLKKYF